LQAPDNVARRVRARIETPQAPYQQPQEPLAEAMAIAFPTRVGMNRVWSISSISMTPAMPTVNEGNKARAHLCLLNTRIDDPGEVAV